MAEKVLYFAFTAPDLDEVYVDEVPIKWENAEHVMLERLPRMGASQNKRIPVAQACRTPLAAIDKFITVMERKRDVAIGQAKQYDAEVKAAMQVRALRIYKNHRSEKKPLTGKADG